MNTTENVTRLVLCSESAAELMTPNPVSIPGDASVKEAVAFLTTKGFSAAPVIDQAGRPIGVLSRADILVHDREGAIPEYYQKAELTTRQGDNFEKGFQVETIDQTCVRDIMTPVVFSVAPETPPNKVVEEMLALKVHRLFVVGRDGVLVGVISALDILRRLRRPEYPDQPW